MISRKSISKSVRLSGEVYRYIDAFDGSGFNDKFSNIILFAMRTEDDRKERISSLDARITQQEQYLKKLLGNASSIEAVYRDAAYVERSIQRLKSIVSQIELLRPEAAADLEIQKEG